MKGHITEYVVGVQNLDEVDAVAARVRGAVGDGYDVTTWREMDVQTSERVNMIGWVLGFVALILFLLVATGIVNTMLMSVYERVREIGTMLAVGMRRRQVTALFMWEAIALGLLGAMGGAGIGYGILRLVARKGVVMHPPGGDVTVIYPRVGFGFLAVVVGFAVAGTVLAALYPAWKASRLRPVEALRAT